MRIRFNVRWNHFAPQEVAEMADPIADELIKRGVASICNEKHERKVETAAVRTTAAPGATSGMNHGK